MTMLRKMKFESTSKYQQVEDLIRDMVKRGGLQPGARLPAEIEIAEKTGTHRLTVNKAMNNLVASGLLYRIHGKGTFVAERKAMPQACCLKTAAILFVGETASNANVYLASPYQTLCTCLSGFDIMVKSFKVDNFSDCAPILDQRPDVCALFTFKKIDEDALKLFNGCGIPVILFNQRAPGVLSVNMDNEGASETLTETLIGKGHKDIVLLHSGSASTTLRERLEGYRKAMESHSLKPMPVQVEGWQAEYAIEALSRLQQEGIPFSAVVCEGALFLQGARQWVDQRKLKTHIACLDNWGGAFGDRMQAECVIETPLGEMGRKIGELMVDILEGRMPDSTDVTVPVKFTRNFDQP